MLNICKQTITYSAEEKYNILFNKVRIETIEKDRYNYRITITMGVLSDQRVNEVSKLS